MRPPRGALRTGPIELAHDGKPRYLAYMPRLWGHLARNLQHPALEDARAFVGDVARPYLENAA